MQSPLDRAQHLTASLNYPPLRAFLLDLRSHGIVISRGQAEEILKVRGEKQIFGPLQPALGRSLAEDLDVRWQADVIDLKNQPIASKSDDTVTYTAKLVCLNAFTRVLYARPLKTKTQEEVRISCDPSWDRLRKNLRLYLLTMGWNLKEK